MSSTRYRVLLIGGCGFFGRRLAQRLAGDAMLQVVIAGRHRARAEALASALNERANASFRALSLDADDPGLPRAIRDVGADVVVHAAGPFQAHDCQDHQVARACIDAGSHYIDLADSRRFVTASAPATRQRYGRTCW